ncbi:hypothetical protein KOAAANKH_01696 [Brevundimonas sp. NIBR10]|nr:hypothetical protein KOAAANKH_01696 [Brevundimonas sp. NIBR10]
MQKPANEWPETERARSVLFVAQAISSLVATDTFESFRMMTLDTPARLGEAIALLRDIESGQLPRATFGPVKDELAWSIEFDPAINHKVHDEPSMLLRSLRSIQSLEKFDIRRLSTQIQVTSNRVTPGYKERLERIIIENYNEISRRKQTLSAVSFYCTHIINLGYSREYVLNSAKRYFFTERVERAGARKLKGFFSLFDGLEYKFTCYAAVSPHFATYLDGIVSGNILQLSDLPVAVSESFTDHWEYDEEFRYVKFQTKARDRYIASFKLIEELSRLRSVTILVSRTFEASWMDDVYVIRGSSDSGDMVQKASVRLSRKTFNPRLAGNSARDSKSLTESIDSQFNIASRDRILNSLSTTFTAAASDDPESRLISLWSAFEILLREPSAGTPRIVHYAELIAPCIARNYARRTFAATYNGLLVNHRTDTSWFTEFASEGGRYNRYQSFVRGIILHDFHEHFRDFNRRISQNPLACFRLHELRDKWSTPKKYSDSIEKHESKLMWQTHRIYRARNNLVHSGRVPAYLDSLTINVFEYYRNALAAIVRDSKDYMPTSDIDHVVEFIRMKHHGQKLMVNEMRGDDEFTLEQIDVVFGKS